MDVMCATMTACTTMGKACATECRAHADMDQMCRYCATVRDNVVMKCEAIARAGESRSGVQRHRHLRQTFRLQICRMQLLYPRDERRKQSTHAMVGNLTPASYTSIAEPKLDRLVPHERVHNDRIEIGAIGLVHVRLVRRPTDHRTPQKVQIYRLSYERSIGLFHTSPHRMTSRGHIHPYDSFAILGKNKQVARLSHLRRQTIPGYESAPARHSPQRFSTSRRGSFSHYRNIEGHRI